MPVYTYKCTICDHRFEARQRYTDNPMSDCPQCEGRLRKVISPVGVVFKGSGFYVTDNRNGKSKGGINGTGQSQTEKPTDSEKPGKSEKPTESTKKGNDRSSEKVPPRKSSSGTASAGSTT